MSLNFYIFLSLNFYKQMNLLLFIVLWYINFFKYILLILLYHTTEGFFVIIPSRLNKTNNDNENFILEIAEHKIFLFSQ